MNDRLGELLTKYWTSQITAREKVELERLLLDHPDHWLKIGLMQQIKWKLTPMLPDEEKERIADKVLKKEGGRPIKKHSPSLKKQKSLPKKWEKVAFAASVLGLIAISFSALKNHYLRPEISWEQVTTMDGMRTTLRLSDGTQVWLNAGSVLRYPLSYDEDSMPKTTREVYLTGEAYFKVKHEPERPFIIHTSKLDTRVPGTEVDIRAYPDEDFSEITLINGTAEVIIKDQAHPRSIRLSPHQKVVVSNKAFPHDDPQTEEKKDRLPYIKNEVDKNIVLQDVKQIGQNLTRETAWKQNTFLFENETLQTLAKRLERWYGVDIIIQDSTLAKQRFTGKADDVSLEKLLSILQTTKPFNYIVHDKKVIIE